MRDRIRQFRDEVGDTHLLGLVRVAIGVLLFANALRAAQELAKTGYFGDVFHLPWLPAALVPSRGIYTALVAAELLLAVLAAVGHRARAALFGSAGLGLFVLLCDRLRYRDDDYALLCFALILSLAPCDRTFAITRGPPRAIDRLGPLWAQRLAQMQLGLIYLASGSSKLLDADWRGGLVLSARFAHASRGVIASGAPAGTMELLSRPEVTSALAKLSIATELFLVFGLFSRRARVLALWLGVVFHLAIQATSEFELFTWLTLAIYALFATPDFQARKLFFDPSRGKGVVYAKAVAALDWLARFEIRPWEPDALKKGHTIVIVRRDGSKATGVRAFAMVARCVPLLFPLWAPLAIVASFTKGGETSTRV